MSVCLYTTSYGQAYAAASFINWVVPLFITGASFVKDQRTGRVGRQFTLVAFGFYIFVWQFVLYTVQTALHVERPDPFCPSMTTNGFPSSSAFHTAVGGTAILIFGWLLDFSYSWSTYIWISAWWIAPPFVLIWFGFNVWQEILVSLCLGIIATLLYFLTLRYYLIELIPYIITQAPWSYLSCLDTWLQDEKGQEKTERIRLLLERL